MSPASKPMRTCKKGHGEYVRFCKLCSKEWRRKRALLPYPQRECTRGHGPFSTKDCPGCRKEYLHNWYLNKAGTVRTCKYGHSYIHGCKICTRAAEHRAMRKKGFALCKLIGYRKRAKRVSLEWAIPDALFFDLVSDGCFYCGNLPSEDKLNGVDRVDNTKGYVVGNVVTACAFCNTWKKRYNVNAFLATSRRIAARFPVDLF